MDTRAACIDFSLNTCCDLPQRRRERERGRGAGSVSNSNETDEVERFSLLSFFFCDNHESNYMAVRFR